MSRSIYHGFGVAGQFDNINAFIDNDAISVDYIFKQGDVAKELPFNGYVGASYNCGGRDNVGARVPLGVTLSFTKKTGCLCSTCTCIRL